MQQPKKQRQEITEQKRLSAEEQIRKEEKEVSYDTKEYTVELLVQKYTDGLTDNENELYIPEYQREFTWPDDYRARFIESVLLGLPIPYIFTARPYKDIYDDQGRIEIVDGSQRIRTLAHFIDNKTELKGLEKLTELNGFFFRDLDISRQRKFKRRPIRVIELSENADDLVRRDIFKRINTGSQQLFEMERRKGVFDGPFYNFIDECANDSLFNELCPIALKRLKREEAQEMVLRYFAYTDSYRDFKKEVRVFIDTYIKEKSNGFNESTLISMRKQFKDMLNFVSKNFPYGFRKNAKNQSVPRIRFEALSAGITLALREKPSLIPQNINSWLESEEFKKYTVSDASNSRPKVIARIEFVKNNLLGK